MTRRPMDFGALVAQTLDAHYPKDAALRQVETHLFATPFSRYARRTRLLKRPLVLAAALSLAVAISLLLVISALLPSPLDLEVDGKAVATPAGTWVEARRQERKTLRFSDGTRVALAPATFARVMETTPRGARVLIERGALRADVIHSEDSDWEFEVGPFSIRVTGTSFDVTWQPDAGFFSVTLHKGSVEVMGPNLATARAVLAGETLRTWVRTAKVEQVSTRYDREAIAAKGPRPRAEGLSAAPLRDAPMIDMEGRIEAVDVSNPPLGKGAASRSDTEGSDDRRPPPSESQSNSLPTEAATPTLINKRIDPIAATTPADVPAPPATAVALSERLKQADGARLSGKHEAAKQSYLSIRSHFSGTWEAALSAFALGRIAFDYEKDYASAAVWFRTYLDEQTDTPLGREALGRLMESEHRADNQNEATQAAKQYLERYPNGPHASLAHAIIGQAEKR